VPLDLRDDSSWSPPTLGLTLESVMERLGLVQRSPDWTRHQVCGLSGEYVIGGQTNGVTETQALQIFVDTGIGERSIITRETSETSVSVSLYNWFQNSPSILCTVDVAFPQHRSLQVSHLRLAQSIWITESV
jgi:hypothetical protein